MGYLVTKFAELEHLKRHRREGSGIPGDSDMIQMLLVIVSKHNFGSLPIMGSW